MFGTIRYFDYICSGFQCPPPSVSPHGASAGATHTHRETMTLEELETALRFTFEARGIYPASLLRPIGRDNYALRSLLKTVTGMNCLLAIGGRKIWTVADLGDALQRERIRAGYSLRRVSDETGLTAAQILRIEKGRGCQKKSLAKYLRCVPVDFELRK